MKKTRLIVFRIVLTALTAAMIGFIFSNSAMTAVDSSQQSGSLLAWINGVLRSMGIDLELSQHFIRKAAHFAEYFVLGALLCATAYAYVRRRGVMLCIALSAGLCTAVADEMIQSGSAGRSCEIGDMALDFTAVAAASLGAVLILYLRRRSREKKLRKKEGTSHE